MADQAARNLLFAVALTLMDVGILASGLAPGSDLIVVALIGMIVLVVAQRVASRPARLAAAAAAEANQLSDALERIDRALPVPDLGAIVDTDLEDELSWLEAEVAAADARSLVRV